ncbi:hypothetical protein BTVI_64956 [Pitangus sulphuratus]|nr:hypothetical protein BTVI_64956 [Pitangus sulphuratus]
MLLWCQNTSPSNLMVNEHPFSPWVLGIWDSGDIKGTSVMSLETPDITRTCDIIKDTSDITGDIGDIIGDSDDIAGDIGDITGTALASQGHW